MGLFMCVLTPSEEACVVHIPTVMLQMILSAYRREILHCFYHLLFAHIQAMFKKFGRGQEVCRGPGTVAYWLKSYYVNIYMLY